MPYFFTIVLFILARVIPLGFFLLFIPCLSLNFLAKAALRFCVLWSASRDVSVERSRLTLTIPLAIFCTVFIATLLSKVSTICYCVIPEASSFIYGVNLFSSSFPILTL